METLKAGKAIPHRKSKEPGVCCLEEGGFESDPTVIYKPIMGLGIKAFWMFPFPPGHKRKYT